MSAADHAVRTRAKLAQIRACLERVDEALRKVDDYGQPPGYLIVEDVCRDASELADALTRVDCLLRVEHRADAEARRA